MKNVEKAKKEAERIMVNVSTSASSGIEYTPKSRDKKKDERFADLW